MREPLGLILAGGLGIRMGGVLKAELTLGDATLLGRAIERLSPQVADVAINSNVAITTALPVLTDATPDHPGPLAGVLAGIDWAIKKDATHIVSVAVDTPFFPCDLVPHLLMAGQSHPDGLAIAATPDGLNPTFGVWPVALRASLATFLDEGGHKVRAFTEAQNAAIAPFLDTSPPPFFNINTPDDLKVAMQWL